MKWRYKIYVNTAILGEIQFVSPIFISYKSNWGDRLKLNLQQLNKNKLSPF